MEAPVIPREAPARPVMSKAGLFAVLGIVAVLLIGGGIALLKMTGKGAVEAPARGAGAGVQAARPAVAHKQPKAANEPEPKLIGDADPVVADKVLLDARDAYVHGHYAEAIDIAKRAERAQPNQAWRLIGASSCFLKDRNGAEEAWNKLDSQGRSFVTYVCKRNGLTIP